MGHEGNGLILVYNLSRFSSSGAIYSQRFSDLNARKHDSHIILACIVCRMIICDCCSDGGCHCMILSISINPVYLHRRSANHETHLGLQAIPRSCLSFHLQTIMRGHRPCEPNNNVLERTEHMHQSSAIVQGIKLVYHSGPVMFGLRPNAICDLR